MEKIEFVEARERLLREAGVHSGGLYEDGLLNRTFTFVSANLLHFMPGMPAAEHETVFRNLMVSRDLSVLEQQYSGILDHVSCEGLGKELFSQLARGPVIFCTFHMGSSRVVNHFLAANRIPYSLVVANHISSEEGEGFVRMFNGIYKSQNEDELTVIRAQESNGVLKMLRELRRGRSLLVYIDGNTGAGDDSIRNENRCRIKLLQQSIYARTGAGFIAHSACAPLIPVVSYRRSIDDIRLKFFPPLHPDRSLRRNVFAAGAIQQLYDCFAPVLQRYPEQWECWIYLHTTANIREFESFGQTMAPRYSINKHRFGFFMIGPEHYLFDKQTYESFLIDNGTYRMLQKAAHGAIGEHEMDPGLFQQLYSHHVLINR